VTKAEQRANLSALIERLHTRLQELPDEKLDTEETNRLLRNIGQASGLIYGLDYEEKEEDAPEELPNAPAPAKEEKEPAQAQEPASGDTEEEEPDPGVTKAELKQKLIDLTNRYDALDVAQIMAGMGYERLSDIPASRYPELLAAVDKAVKELV
jgi:hypothetical protein